MKFYYLSDLQKIDIFIVTLLYCIFFGFFRPFLLNLELKPNTIIIYTLLFFTWYSCTLLLSNAYHYEYIYNKLTNI
jgi:hypothetical protein